MKLYQQHKKTGQTVQKVQNNIEEKRSYIEEELAKNKNKPKELWQAMKPFCLSLKKEKEIKSFS